MTDLNKTFLYSQTYNFDLTVKKSPYTFIEGEAPEPFVGTKGRIPEKFLRIKLFLTAFFLLFSNLRKKIRIFCIVKVKCEINLLGCFKD